MTEIRRLNISKYLVALSTQPPKVGHEGLAPGATAPLAVEKVMDRITSALERIPPDEKGDATSFERAKATVLNRAEASLKKAADETVWGSIGDDDFGAFEAIVHVDGSRPALMLRKGAVPADHPFLGNWANDITGSETAIRRAAASVGRLEPIGGNHSNFFGTAFVIDRDLGLMLTAAHVLSEIVRKTGRNAVKSGSTFSLKDGVRIDFDGEVGSAGSRRLKVVAGMPVSSSQQNLDAAVLRIRPFSKAEDASCIEEEMPGHFDLRLAAAAEGRQIPGSLCLIGYPGRAAPPPWRAEIGGPVDWQWVTYHLMGGKHGVKRIAPGFPSRQPAVGGDGRFEHDATTFGGNSGSPAIAWNDRGEPVFGVHVSGRTLVANQAEWLPAMKEELAKAKEIMRSWRE